MLYLFITVREAEVFIYVHVFFDLVSLENEICLILKETHGVGERREKFVASQCSHDCITPRFC